ncbi:hypothetical protein [Parafrigoribacterium mesophilum]|uniref:hypothetical protein n=1 Tax=Parafrigoribacterium mesophilum TaxID=433646 RepID=UPI0031FDF492
MTFVAVLFLGLAVAASVGNPDRAPVLTLGVAGTAAAMIGVMVVPGFSTLAGAALMVLLALLVVAASIIGRCVTRRRIEQWRRTATAVTVVDLVFMAVTMLLVPENGGLQRLGVATPVGSTGGVGVHAAMPGGLMVWLTLLAWAGCTAVLTLPRQHRDRRSGAFHIMCSGSMIAAMAAMVI